VGAFHGNLPHVANIDNQIHLEICRVSQHCNRTEYFTSNCLFRLLCGLLMFFKTLLVFSTLCRFLNFKL
jgi:hypothetical protein